MREDSEGEMKGVRPLSLIALIDRTDEQRGLTPSLHLE